MQGRGAVVRRSHRDRVRRARLGVEADRPGDDPGGRVDRQARRQAGGRPGEGIPVGVEAQDGEAHRLALARALGAGVGDLRRPVGVGHSPVEGGRVLEARSAVVGNGDGDRMRRPGRGLVGQGARDHAGSRVDGQPRGQTGGRPGEGVPVGIGAHRRQRRRVTLGVPLVSGMQHLRRPVRPAHRPKERHSRGEDRHAVVGRGHRHPIGRAGSRVEADAPRDDPSVRVDAQAGGQAGGRPGDGVPIGVGARDGQGHRVAFGVPLVAGIGHHRRPVGIGHRPGEPHFVPEGRGPVVGGPNRDRVRRARGGSVVDRAGDDPGGRVDGQARGQAGCRPGQPVAVRVAAHHRQGNRLALPSALRARIGDGRGPVGVRDGPGESVAVEQAAGILHPHYHQVGRPREGVVGDRPRDQPRGRVDRQPRRQAGGRPRQGVPVGVACRGRERHGRPFGVGAVPQSAGQHRRPVGVRHRPGERVGVEQAARILHPHHHRVRRPGGGVVGDRPRDQPGRRSDRQARSAGRWPTRSGGPRRDRWPEPAVTRPSPRRRCGPPDRRRRWAGGCLP